MAIAARGALGKSAETYSFRRTNFSALQLTLDSPIELVRFVP